VWAEECGHILNHAEDLIEVSKEIWLGDEKNEIGGGKVTGTSTFRNIAMPFIASRRAISWGVEIMIAPFLR
jgi:hypothetical protein